MLPIPHDSIYANTEIPQQEAYNSAHTKTRVAIEQTYGRWKRRFHVLHSEIRMAPAKVCLIIGACAVLHNIAVLLNEPMDDADLPDELKFLKWKFIMGLNRDWPSEIIFVTHFLAEHLYLFLWQSLKKVQLQLVIWASSPLHFACLEPLFVCLS